MLVDIFMLYFPKENKAYSFESLVCFSVNFRHFHKSISYIIVLILRVGWGCCYPWGRWIGWWYVLGGGVTPPPRCTPRPPFFLFLKNHDGCEWWRGCRSGAPPQVYPPPSHILFFNFFKMDGCWYGVKGGEVDWAEVILEVEKCVLIEKG